MYFNKLLSFTDDKSLRVLINKDVFPDLIEKSVEMGNEQVKKLRDTLVNFAKSKDISVSGRKYFYTAIEEIDVRKSQVFGEEIEVKEVPIETIDHDVIDLTNGNGVSTGHERNGSDEILNHLLIEEGVNTHSPLEDHINNEGYQHIFMADDDPEDDYVDPYENLSQEEMMARLPPYFNKSLKQKRKYFKKLNQKYISSLKMPGKANGNDEKAKITFDLKKNSIRKFKRKQKIAFESNKP